jgi:threonine/homoserine/homoserine lactone efflux protein
MPDSLNIVVAVTSPGPDAAHVVALLQSHGIIAGPALRRGHCLQASPATT